MAESHLIIGPFSEDTSWAPMPRYGGRPIGLVLTEEVEHSTRCRDRIRPNGESGSGPYFNAYKSAESGVREAYACGSYVAVSYGENVDDYVDASGVHRIRMYTACGQYHVTTQARFAGGKGNIATTGRVLQNIRYTSQKGQYGSKGMYPTVERDSDLRAMAESAHRTIVMFCEAALVSGDFSGMAGLMRAYTTWASPYELKPISFNYVYGERDAFEFWRIADSLPRRYDALWSSAYVNAVQNLPDSNTNSIANIAEVLSMINNLRKGRLDLPKTWKDLWLSYRYSYLTTKSDIEAYADLTRRLVALSNQRVITSYGVSDDGDIRCQSSISVCVGDLFPNLQSFADKFGLKLSYTNAWDLVPYSFIIDWFLNIGDMISLCEARNWAYTLPVQESWVSFATLYDNQSTYFRVNGRPSLSLPYVTKKTSSGKTITMRILDTIALFF